MRFRPTLAAAVAVVMALALSGVALANDAPLYDEVTHDDTATPDSSAMLRAELAEVRTIGLHPLEIAPLDSASPSAADGMRTDAMRPEVAHDADARCTMRSGLDIASDAFHAPARTGGDGVRARSLADACDPARLCNNTSDMEPIASVQRTSAHPPRDLGSPGLASAASGSDGGHAYHRRE